LKLAVFGAQVDALLVEVIAAKRHKKWVPCS